MTNKTHSAAAPLRGVGGTSPVFGVEFDQPSHRGPFGQRLRRLRKSLATRGVRLTLKGVAAKLDDRWFDLWNGTDTAGRIELHALNIQSENKSRGVAYTPTHAGALRRVIRALDLPKDSVLVDLGCGKGKVLLLAAQYRFKRIVGVEFSGELCRTARRNVDIFRMRRSLATDIEIVERDAAVYPIEDDENVFFLFNPFDRVVMRRVMANITASLERRHRRIWIVYNNPVHRGVLRLSDAWVEASSFVHGSSAFTIYQNRLVCSLEPAASRLR